MKFKSIFVTAATVLLATSSLMLKTPNQAYADTTSTTTKTEVTTQPKVSESNYEANIKGVQPLNVDQYLSKVASGDKFIVFIGFKECSHCRAFSPVMKQFLKEAKQPVYYFDYGPEGSLKTASQETRNQFFDTFNSPFDFMGTPTVAVFSKGKVVSMTVGDDTTLSDLQQLETDYSQNQ